MKSKLVLLLMILFVSCSKVDPVSPVYSISGAWDVTFTGTTTMYGQWNLSESNGTVSGTAVISGSSPDPVAGNITKDGGMSFDITVSQTYYISVTGTCNAARSKFAGKGSVYDHSVYQGMFGINAVKR